MPGKSNGNGLTKTRSIATIVTAIITVLGVVITVLYFFFSVDSGLTKVKEDHKTHVARSEKELEQIREEIKDHSLLHDKRLAQYTPSSQLKIEFKNMRTTLDEMKGQITRCQDEDSEFKQQLFDLILEIKTKIP